jgi:hypothetical protein
MNQKKKVAAAATKKKTGFALMDTARLRQVSSQAGRNSQATGRGHKFTSEEAARAARLRSNAQGAAPLKPEPR